MAIDAVGPAGRVARAVAREGGASFEEGLEYRIGVLEVVVHDIHEERCLHEVRDELARR